MNVGPAAALTPLYSANAKYLDGVGFGYAPTATGSGLSLSLTAGTAFCGNPPAAVTYTGGSLTLTNGTNYVYLDPTNACAPASNTSGFSTGQIPIATVVASGGNITTITDLRHAQSPLPCAVSSAGSVNCAALGTNQNVSLTPSGTGSTLLNGKVGVGTASPQLQLDVAGAMRSGVNLVTFSPTPTFDASLGNTQKITLTGNVTSSTLANAQAGQIIYFTVLQDGSGSRAFVWPAKLINPPAVSQTANAETDWACKFDGTNCQPLTSGSGGSGTVTTTGSPASGNLTKFSSATSITNADLSGDVTTNGTLSTTVTKVNGQTPGGTCANQAVTALSSSAVPTCATLTSSYVDTSIAKTGTDINTSNQVTATHLASGLPIAQGGTGQTSASAAFNALSPLTTEGDLHYYHSSSNTRLAVGTNGQCLTSNGTDPVWGACGGGGGGTVTTTGSPASGNLTKFSSATSITNADLSGDVTTSGTLATTVAKVNGVSYPGSPSTNTVPVVTGSNTITYQSVPNAALANSSLTLNGTANQITSPGATALGGTATFALANPLTFPGKTTHAASTGSAASMNIPAGTAPTTPATGDIWNPATSLVFYDGTANRTLAATGSCTNQAVTGTSSTGVSCATLTSSYVDTSIAKTGTDINTSNQVTATHLASALPIAQGGTGQTSASGAFNGLSPLTTEGDLLYYHSSANARVGVGTNGQCLTSNGTDPVWGSCGGGSGTVTSVAMSGDGTIFNSTVSGSPVTSSGTLAPALLTQAKNTVLAGPATGSNAAPTFRAIGAADLPAATASNLGAIVPRYGLAVDSSGNLDLNPLDGTSVILNEDFLNSAASSGSIGEYGWKLKAIASSNGAVAYASSTLPHPGQATIQSGSTTAGMGLELELGDQAILGGLGASAGWDSKWWFSIDNTASAIHRIGIFSQESTTLVPANGFYLRYDTSLGTPDTNFMLCVDLSSAETCQNTGVAADTSWHTVRIRSTTNGQILMTLDSGTEYSFCASGCNVTATIYGSYQMNPAAIAGTNTNATRKVVVDKFAFIYRGVNR